MNNKEKRIAKKINLLESNGFIVNGELTKDAKATLRQIKSGSSQQFHIIDCTEDVLKLCEIFEIKHELCLKTKVELYGVDNNKLGFMYEVTKYKALIN